MLSDEFTQSPNKKESPNNRNLYRSLFQSSFELLNPNLSLLNFDQKPNSLQLIVKLLCIPANG